MLFLFAGVTGDLTPALATGQTDPAESAAYQGSGLDATQSADDWFTINKDYFSTRYVDLELITPENVSELSLQCEIALNEPSWYSSGILKIGRTLYFTTRRMTYAVDAVTCEQRWSHRNDELLCDPDYVDAKICPPASSNNRGLAYLKGDRPDYPEHMLFRGTANGFMIALDAETGTPIWRKQYANPNPPPDGNTAVPYLESIIAAPVAANGKVFVGIATADLGVCGHVMAFDAYTGRQLWRYYTVPVTTQGGETSCQVWGGGAQWTTLSIDPDEHELYVPVSNPHPDYRGDERPGANLQTNSIIVLDTDTPHLSGKLKWYYQAVSHDVHDWDLGTAPVLYTTGGENGSKDMLAIAGKDGFVYGVDRETQELVFQTAGTRLANIYAQFPVDPSFPPKEAAVRVCPGSVGGAQFTGPSYDPKRGSLFIGMNDYCWFYFEYKGPATPGKHAGHVTATDILGADEDGEASEEEHGSAKPDLSLDKPPIGYVNAIDAETGELLWRFQTPAQVQAGTVATKSGIVFAADTLNSLYALDAETGEPLAIVPTGGSVNSGLITYQVDNKQYVAAEVGGLSLNPPGITEPLRKGSALMLKIFTRNGEGRVAKSFDRHQIIPDYELPPKGDPQRKIDEGGMLYGVICTTCHGNNGKGTAYPTLRHQAHILTDKDRLMDFFQNVPPPMPQLYPGLLNSDDVENLAAYFGTWVKAGHLEWPNPGYDRPKTPARPTDWQKIYSVLTDPRCINCHTSTEYPRQTKTRHPHFYGVTRGKAYAPGSLPDGGEGDMGSAIRRCVFCHGDSNNELTGAPGVEGTPWRLAPLKDRFESSANVAKSEAKLCEQIKKYAMTHDNEMTHLGTPLVKWAWDAGIGFGGEVRWPPPIPYDEFIDTVDRWLADGMPCPEDSIEVVVEVIE